MLTTTVTKLPLTPRKPLVKRATRKLAAPRAQLISCASAGSVALILTGLSLTHLASGIALVTGAPMLEAIALAIGIDLGFIALEAVNLSITCDKLRRNVARYVTTGIVGTLTLSAVLNALAFGANPGALNVYAAATLGLVIPGLVYILTRTCATIAIASRKS